MIIMCLHVHVHDIVCNVNYVSTCTCMYLHVIFLEQYFQFVEVTDEASALRDQLEQLKVCDHNQYYMYLWSFCVCMWTCMCIYMYMCVLLYSLKFSRLKIFSDFVGQRTGAKIFSRKISST